ncbi:PTS cellobiose transporter subunit IIC [Clostridium tagluense]|uniref:PTS cellobiose transporter subunit IIC n=1 Tax=Clostridium tagluense TaxID=360422 RepID=UPI001CF2749F|nr:PTS cellobiose transporter subunit IIC [Clostridium tagluense]MCB2310339.1 PTS cellobiose transporter subunit IIC [Clostridium tagluense]MCB2315019.1 PTS cellobiose transporter subunit IIC [Clostridium tagluense]MCB2320039.1 PTS cellobiose transporter subunit IIC [Clostridium tagluense]MCB2324762.1 PTS cellobiose transporter subunit IIC [Clostridium tagluense]MCB2329784.1 PTS cellobiose transporter subunit IIC [Clostridium tagluense]
MNKILAFLEKRLMPVASKVAAQRHMQAMRDGMVLGMPLLIAGSIFLILCNIPLPNGAWPKWLASTFGPNFQGMYLAAPAHATFWIFSLIVCMGISYYLAQSYHVDQLPAAVIALACFFTVTPQDCGGVKGAWGVSFGNMGPGGVFVAIIVAFISTEVYRRVIQKNITIKMPESVPPAIAKSFAAMIPGIACIFTMFIIHCLCGLTPYGNLHALITKLIQIPLSNLGTSLPATLLIVFLIHLLWICGLHGAIIVGGLMEPVWLSYMETNLNLYKAGSPVTQIISKQFFDSWVYVGGSGATLALVILMVVRAKSKQGKTFGKSVIGSSLFNINEPVIFGMPIVMNALLIIPFILTPLVLVVVTYFSMKWGFVAKPVGIVVHWATPPIIGGFLATGGKISGAVLQIVNFGIAMVIYYPFFLAWDKKCVQEEGQATTTSAKAKANVNI